MYEDHYGLTERPFQLTPDPRFYFDSATHRKAMAYLGYGLAQGEGFIVITGDIGAGKTTLVAHLMATIDAARLTAVKIVSTQVEGDDMLRLAAQALGLPTEGVAKAQLLDRIERVLHDQARLGKRVLLIVDEAQNLSISALEELRMLSNFTYGGRALVQIFLLGQPEFRDAIHDSDQLEQLRQRVIATHHLTPMSADEVGPYVLHRLTRAGWSGNPGFTADAWEALYRFSDGVPRKINMLGARLLLQGALDGLEMIDDATVEAVVADMTADDVRPEKPALARPHIAYARPAAPETRSETVVRVERVADPEQGRRIAALEARLDEQEQALRRVLTLLIDWAESDDARPAAMRSGVA